MVMPQHLTIEQIDHHIEALAREQNQQDPAIAYLIHARIERLNRERTFISSRFQAPQNRAETHGYL